MIRILIIIAILAILTSLFFFEANKLIKKTNWWTNQFVFTKAFPVYNPEARNLTICNVGSNPARFAFHYDDILGANWSTGTQGLDMDLLLLKYNCQYLQKGAIVLLPIVQFSSVSGYLDKNGVSNVYLAKFANCLAITQVKKDPLFKGALKYLKYPLFYKPKAVKSIIRNPKPDSRLEISDNFMQMVDMKQDAIRWMKCWTDEFNIKDLHAPLYPELQKGRERSIEMMCDMVSFLLERGYKPVLVSTPMSSALAEHFSQDIKETYIYSFVRAIQDKYDIQYLDYTNDESLSKHDLYFNALFMNLRGRKLFTKRVLKDLGLI